MTLSNKKQSIPPLFKEIIRNDNERADLRAQAVIPFETACRLRRERRDYRREAEKVLHWNVDKGNRK